MSRFDVNCSILFSELPLLERPAAARAAGFDAIELWWPWSTPVPTDKEASTLAAAITDAGVALVGLNFFAGDMAGGDRGLLSWPARAKEFQDNIEAALAFGSDLGCRAFNALYGNRIEGVSAEEQGEVARENLSLVSTAAARRDAIVLIEALSGPQPYPLRRSGDVVAVLDAAEDAGLHNVKMLADLYHFAANGEDPRAAITASAARFGHVQIADAPGRHEPGTGDLDIAGLIGQLDAAGYDGWVGLEYLPSAKSEDSFGWLTELGWPPLASGEQEGGRI